MGTTFSTGTVIAAQAVNAGSKMVNLFRSMSDAELAAIAKSKVFDAGFNMEEMVCHNTQRCKGVGEYAW